LTLKTAVSLVSGLVLVPVVWSSLEATHGYLTGTATIRYAGYPGPPGFNLDPRSRIPLQPRGCTLGPARQLLTLAPNNLTLELLVAAFGPMRGTYHGPYPTFEEASAAVRAESALAVDPGVAREAGRGGIPALTCRSLADDRRSDRDPWPDGAAPPSERCAEFQGETVLLTVEDRIVLLERRTGTRYAMYYRARETADVR
jgi:hypothetical protein